MHQQTQSGLNRFLCRLISRSVLSREEQEAILNLPTQAVQVQANRDVVRLGEQLDYSSLIVDGFVGSFGENLKRERQITGLHIPGDMPDLHSVVLPKGGVALQALSTTTILRIPHQALRAVAARYPAISEAFWRDCMVDAAILSQWVVNVGRRDAKARLAHLICEVAIRVKVDVRAEAVLFGFQLTQNHLADATGLTPVHVNRTLKVLRDAGILYVAGRTVHILKWEELKRIGEFDAGYLDADGARAHGIEGAGVPVGPAPEQAVRAA